MKAFLLFSQLSLIWSIPVPQGFSHSSDVHHVSVTFGNSQVPQSPVALAHPPYTLQAVHPIQAPAQPAPFHTLTVHSTPLHHQINHHPAPAVVHHQVDHHPVVHHQVNHHPVVHHQVGQHPEVHHQVGHHPVVHHQHHAGVSLLHPVTHDHHLVSRHPLAAAHFYRLAPDHPASRAPAFFSSELLPVKVEELVAGSLEVARGPKQLEEIEEGDDYDNFEAKEGDSKDSENEAEKEKEEEGTEKLGRMPRLLVIEDIEEEGSADDPQLEDILVIEDFVEKSSGDDQELDDILEDLLTTSEEEISPEALKNEPSGNNSIEEETVDEVSQGDSPKEIVSPKTEQEEEEKTSPVKDSKDSASTPTESAGLNSVDVGSAENNVSREEEDITPLKGIKTILVVTTNPDENGRPDMELPAKSPEEKVNSEEFLGEEDKNVK